MPGMEELKNLIGELFEALVALLAFFTLILLPVPFPYMWLVIAGWFAACCYVLYRKARHERVSKD